MPRIWTKYIKPMKHEKLSSSAIRRYRISSDAPLHIRSIWYYVWRMKYDGEKTYVGKYVHTILSIIWILCEGNYEMVKTVNDLYELYEDDMDYYLKEIKKKYADTYVLQSDVVEMFLKKFHTTITYGDDDGSIKIKPSSHLAVSEKPDDCPMLITILFTHRLERCKVPDLIPYYGENK